MGQPIPVTVVGGYLGAGKTTLVNHLLREAGSRARDAGGRRLAVLVNDFGELPIDADLIESADGDTIAIAGGCVCCTIGSDLVAALQALGERDPAPDHVLIEASGVALPGGIGAAVSLLPRFRLDGPVTVVDATSIRERAADRYLADTVQRQMDDADLLVVTKTDRLDDAARASLLEWLGHPAQVVEAPFGRVAPEVVLGLAPSTKHRGGLLPGLHPAYASRSYDGLPPLDLARLVEGLCHRDGGLLRAKGVLRDLDGATKILHVVGQHASLEPSPPAGAGRLVCIGLKARFDGARIDRLIESLTSETTP